MERRDYLVIDLEATCDDQGQVPRQEMEIIEIGAVLVDGETFAPKAEFQSFVRPVRHPRLTPFCQKLTSISQEEVDGAPGFVTVLRALADFMGHQRPLFSSWGNYDKGQFGLDAKYHGSKLPFGKGHLNIKAAFSRAIGTRKRFGMAGALRKLRIPLEGTHHRGIDDARNIAKILPYAAGAIAIPRYAADEAGGFEGRRRRG